MAPTFGLSERCSELLALMVKWSLRPAGTSGLDVAFSASLYRRASGECLPRGHVCRRWRGAGDRTQETKQEQDELDHAVCVQLLSAKSWRFIFYHSCPAQR